MRKLTTEEFIKRAKKIHGDKYDYSKAEYSGSKIKICIICPKHGEFWQIPNAHLNGQGCPECGSTKKLTTEEFIKRAKKIHGNKYDYSKVKYSTNHKKICIICPKHGEFWQQPSDHLNGHGCRKCLLDKLPNINKLTTEEFIKRAKKIHGDKYDYSKVKYTNSKTAVCIICPKHGEFWQIPNYHLSKCGCQKCAEEEFVFENKLYKILLDNIDYDIIRQKKFIWLKYKNKMSLDFYIPSKKIAIEYQGEQHFKKYNFEQDNSKLLERQKRDLEKIKLCKEHNIKLLHFSFCEKYCKNNTEYKVFTNINELLNNINGNF